MQQDMWNRWMAVPAWQWLMKCNHYHASYNSLPELVEKWVQKMRKDAPEIDGFTQCRIAAICVALSLVEAVARIGDNRLTPTKGPFQQPLVWIPYGMINIPTQPTQRHTDADSSPVFNLWPNDLGSELVFALMWAANQKPQEMMQSAGNMLMKPSDVTRYRNSSVYKEHSEWKTYIASLLHEDLNSVPVWAANIKARHDELCAAFKAALMEGL